MIPVALNGDVVVLTIGTTPPPGAPGPGSWAPGTISYTDVDYTSVDGTMIIREARCTFTFTVAGPPPVPFATSEVVLAPPIGTYLTDNGNDVLRLGDTIADSYGNTLTASPTQTKLNSGP